MTIAAGVAAQAALGQQAAALSALKATTEAIEQTTQILQEGVLASATLGQNLDILV